MLSVAVWCLPGPGSRFDLARSSKPNLPVGKDQNDQPSERRRTVAIPVIKDFHNRKHVQNEKRVFNLLEER
jgi:hypothetical protein